jgi:hypothetical protein
VAWRKPVSPARIEPPEWYRTYHAEAWDEPDGQEQAMVDGCPSAWPWPDWLHDHHSRRRWHEAKHAYRQEHPALAEQEFADLIERHGKRRAD